MTQQPATNRQIPDNAILDHFNKQDYLGNRFNYVLSVTAGGTTEVAEILIQNPSVTSTAFPATNKALFVDLRRLSGHTASADNLMRVYLNPTVTSVGTPATGVSLRPANTNTTSVAVLHSAPTISVNGTLVEVLSGIQSTVEAHNLIILDPGQAMLVTLQTANAAVAELQVSWYEL